MVKNISFVDKCMRKLLLKNQERIFQEIIGNAISSVKILSNINIVNRNGVIGKDVFFWVQ